MTNENIITVNENTIFWKEFISKNGKNTKYDFIHLLKP